MHCPTSAGAWCENDSPPPSTQREMGSHCSHGSPSLHGYSHASKTGSGEVFLCVKLGRCTCVMHKYRRFVCKPCLGNSTLPECPEGLRFEISLNKGGKFSSNTIAWRKTLVFPSLSFQAVLLEKSTKRIMPYMPGVQVPWPPGALNLILHIGSWTFFPGHKGVSPCDQFLVLLDNVLFSVGTMRSTLYISRHQTTCNCHL